MEIETPRHRVPENSVFLGRDGSVDLWWRIRDGVPQVDWYMNGDVEQWLDADDPETNYRRWRRAAIERAKGFGLPVTRFVNPLPKICEQLKRLDTEEKRQFLIINSDGDCWLLEDVDLPDDDSDATEWDATIDNIVEELKAIPTPPASVRRQIEDAEELTPEFLRQMADQLEEQQ